MSTLMFYVGIAVTFVTVWGVVIVGGYMLGGESPATPTTLALDTMTDRPTSADSDLLG